MKIAVFITFTVCICCLGILHSQHIRPLPYTITVSETDTTLSVRCVLDSAFVEEAHVNSFSRKFLQQAGFVPLLQSGKPDLCRIAVPILVPYNTRWQLINQVAKQISFSNIDIPLSQGNTYRQLPSSTMPLKQMNINTTDPWPSQLFEWSSMHTLAKLNGIVLFINPFSCSDVSKSIDVRISIDLTFHKIYNPDKLINAGWIDVETANYIKRHYFNTSNISKYYAPVDEMGRLLIIAPQNFFATLQPLVRWKIMKGIPTEMVDVSSIGNTATDIKNFLSAYYALHPDFKFLLLAGDVQQVATPIKWNGAADPTYGHLLGNDSYAEVFVGRLSAQTINDLNTQVQKILNYEMLPDTTTTAYSNGTVVASNAGPGDDGEMDWEHARNMRAKLLNFTYTNVQEMYDGSHSGGNDQPGDPLAFDLFNAIISGTSIVTYTGHGTQQSLTTTGLTSADVDNLTNTKVFPIVWSVACDNGNFNNGDCIAESFMRAANNGQPAGAVAVMMSSINQSWSPPMDAQDEIIDLLCGTYANNVKHTVGGLGANGCMHMNDAYGAIGDEMTDTWHIFGDPSMVVRTMQPINIVAQHTNFLGIGDQQLALYTNAMDGATVCLSVADSILCTSVVFNGYAFLQFTAITSADTIFLTITSFNAKPYTAAIPVYPTSLSAVAFPNNFIFMQSPHAIIVQTKTPIIITHCTIYDMQGRIVQFFSPALVNQSLAIETGSLVHGHYILVVKSGDNEVHYRFSK